MVASTYSHQVLHRKPLSLYVDNQFAKAIFAGGQTVIRASGSKQRGLHYLSNLHGI